jgi:deoxyribonuclease (pyrimidine dimer)
MTRINCIPVTELNDKQLQAEYVELPRVFSMAANAERHNRLKSLPWRFCYGEGHVRFFYNKLEYCAERHVEITKEMFRRELKVDMVAVDQPWRKHTPSFLWGNWTPSQWEINLCKEELKKIER